jgi:hypothetical protein
MGIFASSSAESYVVDETFGEYDPIYVKQKYNWDCGVVCVKMALRCSQLDASAVEQTYIAKIGTPCWTIDLYCVMKELGVHDSTMYTTSLGVASSHTEIRWYQAQIDSDTHRVNGKFEVAKVFTSVYLMLAFSDDASMILSYAIHH